MVRVRILGWITLTLFLLCVTACEQEARMEGATFAPEMKLSLAGEWSFQLDPKDAGEEDKWFDKDLPLRIKLPG
ncbi:MAG: hypothetical protein ACYTE5_09945, partial [Planctomycetota bacterium]